MHFSSIPLHPRKFITTMMTLIRTAQQDREAMGRFLSLYQGPVCACAMGRGMCEADAAELTQDFFTKVIEKRLLEKYNRVLGRFHTWLLACFWNHVRDVKRRRAVPTTADTAVLEGAAADDAEDTHATMINLVATNVFNEALEALERACRNGRMQRQWTVFEMTYLKPHREGTPPATIEQIMAAVGATDRQKVYTMRDTMKDKLRREMKRVVAKHVPADDVDDSYRDVLRALGIECA